MRSIAQYLLILILLLLGCPRVLFGQDVYSQLPVNTPGHVWVEVSTQSTSSYSYASSQSSYSSTTQSYAQAEANRLAQGGRNYYRAHGGHPGGNMPGARFTGTGYSTSPHNVPTCEPKTRMQLIADAVQRGVDGLYYRVRAWR
jgi:hypothetical protein